jgi:hypothetical protein
LFQGQNYDFLLSLTQWFLLSALRFIKILLDFIKDFSCKIQKHLCNALGLDDMHVLLPSLEYKPPSLMLHHHRVSLFVIQSLLYFSYSPAHSSYLYANPPLKCKSNAHPGLFTMIIAFIVRQAWPCPKCDVTWFIMKELNKSFIS